MRILLITLCKNEIDILPFVSQYWERIGCDVVVFDNGSTDGSKEIIEQCKDKLFYYVSELDNGIYNAMNKGIRASVSDYLLFLNSGDYLSENNVLERVFPYLDGDYDFVYGNEWKVNEKSKNYSPYEAKYPDKLDESFFRRTSLPHQSTFISVKYHKQHPYREDCVIAGDWTFFREAVMKYGATYKHIPFVISNYGVDGISSKQYGVFKKEKDEYYKNLTNE